MFSKTDLGAHPDFYCVGRPTGFVPRELRGWGMKLTADIHLLSRLRIRGAMPLILHAFMA
jgi:hypothetical protein